MVLLITICSSLFFELTAQYALSVSNDTVICQGQSAQLYVTGGSSYVWGPAATLNNAHSSNPVATPGKTTRYAVTTQVQTPNLVVNGNFSSGDTGFTSSYIYEVPPNSDGEQRYWIGTNAATWNSGLISCPDHTTGTGNMLIANGAEIPQTPVWCETFAVYPNSTYTLSGWIQPLKQANFPQAQWMVNGTPVGNATGTFLSCIWLPFTATWNSGNDTIASFCIFDLDTIAYGNDYAIDDISITAKITLTDTITVSVVNPPVIHLGNDTSICSTQTVVLDAGNTGSTYLWSNNDTSQTITLHNPGNYSVTATNYPGCSATGSITISPYHVPVSVFAVNTSCGADNGSDSTVIQGGNPPFQYAWNNDSTSAAIYNLPGGNYSVTVTDANGCTASANGAVNSFGSGNSVTISAGQTLICPHDSAEICAPSGYHSYEWNTGETASCIYAKSAGNYYATVTDAGNCTAVSNPVAIYVHQLPPVSVSRNGDTLMLNGELSCQWYFNSNLLPGDTSNICIATQPGNYNVLITDSGCTVSSNTFSVETGIDNLPGDNIFSVYPNPLETGYWNLLTDENMAGAQLKVFDAKGSVVYNTEIAGTKTKIDLPLAPGVYILQIVAHNKLYFKKLVRL